MKIFKSAKFGILAVVTLAICSMLLASCTYVQDVKTVDLKEKYFQNEESELGSYVKECVNSAKKNVNVEYIDEGAIDTYALREKFETENINLKNTSKTIDSLTTEVVEAFYGSIHEDAKEHIKFNVNNDINIDLESILNRAMVNYDETGEPTIILMTSTTDKAESEIAQMQRLNDVVKEAKNHGTFLIMSTNIGGNLISDYKYTCLDDGFAINSCNYDGSPRGNENLGDEDAHIDFALPSDHSYTSAALFASIVSQIAMTGDDLSTIEEDLTGYVLTSGGGEDKAGNGVLSQRKLA